MSGWVVLNSSVQTPLGAPRSMSKVPIAPSPTRISLRSFSRKVAIIYMGSRWGVLVTQKAGDEKRQLAAAYDHREFGVHALACFNHQRFLLQTRICFINQSE